MKKRQKQRVLVHFDGWSDKWKQWHCIHSALLAPLRMYSRGYTGQTTVALREWDFNEEYLKIVNGKVRILLHNKFEGFSPYDLAVLLRGDLFVLVDCILTYTYTVFPTQDPLRDYSKVLELFGLVTDLALSWMLRAPEVYTDVSSN